MRKRLRCEFAQLEASTTLEQAESHAHICAKLAEGGER